MISDTLAPPENRKGVRDKVRRFQFHDSLSLIVFCIFDGTAFVTDTKDPNFGANDVTFPQLCHPKHPVPVSSNLANDGYVAKYNGASTFLSSRHSLEEETNG
jgi:hypothetical protein